MKHFTKFVRSQLVLMKPFLENCSLATARRGQDRIGKLMSGTFRHEVSSEDFSLGEFECSMIAPKDELSNGVILYLHGGGYTAGNLAYAKGFGTVLCAECGIHVLCAAYRLAPEHVFPAALQDATDAYGYLLSHGYAPSQIVLCGESAGGGLCYSLCLKLREKGWSLPAGIIAISPWTDLSSSGESYEKNKKNDPSMTQERLKYFADCYLYGSVSDEKELYPARNEDAEDDRIKKQNPLVSPLFGELHKMPPSLIFVGGDEVMMDDSVELHRKLLAAGCRSTLTVTPDMWHAYVLYGLKENEKDIVRIRSFVKATVPNQKKLRWMMLDNAAKIFPAARRRNWSNTFRLSATLRDRVDVEVLRTALDVTVRRFPSMAVRLKTGFFWYTLEEIPKAPEIMEEKPYPLSHMIFDDVRKCALRVIVYEKRIAVEFFHAIADGNGGLVFLKTLVSEYCYQKYGVKIPIGNGVLDRLETPSEDELEDSFFRYAGPKCASRADTNAFKLSGIPEADGFKTNTSFILNADEVAAEAKKRGITVTAYLSAVLILATERVQKERVRNPARQKHVKLLLPVNLRKIFPSTTLRNFVLYVTPGIDPALGDYEFDEICNLIYHQMKLQITPKNLASMIAANVISEKQFILRATPLFLKNFIMKLIYNAVGEKKSCFSFSNLGVVKMPEEFETYVDRLDFVLGVQSSAPYNTSAITYKGNLILNIIRNIREPVLEREIYGVLHELGIHVCAESNTREEEK